MTSRDLLMLGLLTAVFAGGIGYSVYSTLSEPAVQTGAAPVMGSALDTSIFADPKFRALGVPPGFPVLPGTSGKPDPFFVERARLELAEMAQVTSTNLTNF